MLRATRILRDYIGPSAESLARCYDKLEATKRVAAAGFDCPAMDPAPPFIVKPRFGSDSLGVRLSNRLVAGKLAQERIIGTELTVAVANHVAGMPLAIELAPGEIYSFTRKYLRRPRRAPVQDETARKAALDIARLLGVDWVARVDFIREPAGRLVFLECDAAPLVGPHSAFAESLAAAGIDRRRQLDLLTRTEA
jgi:predicted ATP-grasp superfamily ATP-dependent carboligase